MAKNTADKHGNFYILLNIVVEGIGMLQDTAILTFNLYNRLMEFTSIPCDQHPLSFVQNDMESILRRKSWNNIIFTGKSQLMFHFQWK